MTENSNLTLRNVNPQFNEIGKMDSPKPEAIYSPMTDLANNMSIWELKSGFEDTPKRRLSISSTDTPTPVNVKGGKIKPKLLEKQLSFESGSFGNTSSPSAASPFFSDGSTSILPSVGVKATDLKHPFKSAALARFGNLPVPFCGFGNTPGKDVDHIEPHLSPEKFDREGSTSIQEKVTFSFDDDEENSRDSGVSVDSAGKNQDGSFHFAEPHAPAPRKSRVLSEDACSPLKYSPIKASSLSRSLSFGNLSLQSPHGSSSPVLRKSSLTHSPEQDDGDDGFLELLELDEQEHKIDDKAPKGLADLISAPLLLPKTKELSPFKVKKHRRLAQLENQENISPKASSRRGLFRSPSMPGLRSRALDGRGPVKRAEPDHPEDDTPYTQVKRKKSCVAHESPKVLPTRSLHRCHSETEAMIKAALNKVDDNQDLIGDFSKAYSLPLTTCKHRDLKGISPETMAAVLRGEYSHLIEKFVIIDCRYPYEYEGGHLKFAKNIYTRDGILEEFIKSDKHHKTRDSCGNTALIFHCEFSSERGPKLSRFLRENDRASNKDCYPSLHFPEIYLLEGGYKAFFEKHKNLCEPQTYKPMLHKDHEEDLRHFRIKSRTWGGEKGRGARGPFRTGLKF